MKKLAMAALIGTFALVGCSTTDLVNERNLVVEGEAKTVKVVNIPNLKIELAPNKAVCEVVDSSGKTVTAECLQYRQTFQKNYNTFNGDIQGFTYESGYRYVLDVRQEAVANTEAGVVEPVWYLNEVISKNAE